MKTYLVKSIRLASAVLLGALASHAAGAADASQGGPQSLIITYHTTPANRAAFHKELEKAGAKQFQHWKDEHVLADYQILFNRFADSDNPDAVALLKFANEAEAARWKKVEQAHPAGLTNKALALVTAVHTAPADLVRSDRSAESTKHSVFMVIPYETMVSAGEYLKYADGYTIPQFEGWMHEGVLSHYDVFVNRYAAGRPWSTMIVLEYKDDAALGKREEVVAKVRARLKDSPDWKAISDSKKNVRNEKQLVVADPIVVR
ncbi:MAG TPA: hypothetical protein VF450_12400 [Noviherbaspirillum sp.]